MTCRSFLVRTQKHVVTSEKAVFLSSELFIIEAYTGQIGHTIRAYLRCITYVKLLLHPTSAQIRLFPALSEWPNKPISRGFHLHTIGLTTQPDLHSIELYDRPGPCPISGGWDEGGAMVGFWAIFHIKLPSSILYSQD